MTPQTTVNFSNALRYAEQEARRLGAGQVAPEHLMLALLRLPDDEVRAVLQHKNINLEELKNNLDFITISAQRSEGSDSAVTEEQKLPLAPATQRILLLADLEMLAAKQTVKTTRHLLSAIMKEGKSETAQLLTSTYSLTYEDTVADTSAAAIPSMEGFMDAEDDEEEEPKAPKDEKKQEQGEKRQKSATPALDSYGVDVTRKAAQGELDPVIGREEEITRVVQILSRRRKNNPILIGEPGVGKSAIVEGLAIRIANHDVAPMLFQKRIFTLDLASMVAGTKYRGQFEERMKAVLSELEKNRDIILFIDEIHNIMGAGNASGSLDAANILKPALSRGDIQCIGATTLNEYRQSIEKDGALERRFQKVIVKAPTSEQTLSILRQLAPRYAAHHSVVYTDAALKAAVELTGRYITDRAFPDKAIDAIDEAGANKRITTPLLPNSINDIQKQLDDLRKQKNEALKVGDFNSAVELRSKERDLDLALKGEISRWENATKQQTLEVTEDDIARVVAMMSGVPVERLTADENTRLQELGQRLARRVIGQQRAIDLITKAIQRSRVGLKSPNRPIGTFLFLGPTGVGKTYLAQCLAEDLFGKREALIRIDMSEYMEKHAVSLLVGAPPGYVAYEEGGKLTEAVRRQPYSIVLFDEIEKAHPDVFNILLQVMDEGRLTDRQGRHIDFRNTVIVLTSNSGTRQLKDFGQGIGFHDTDVLSHDKAETILRKSLNKTFAPEFLNRIDNIVVFDQLTEDALRQIVDIELEQTRTSLAAMGYMLELTDSAMQLICKKGYDVQYGARPVKRAVQSLVLDPITELLMAGKADDTKLICIDSQGDSTIATWVR